MSSVRPVGRPPIPEATRRRLNDTVSRLAAVLPATWTASIERRTKDGGTVCFEVDEEPAAAVTVMAFGRLEPRDVDRLPPTDGAALVYADWVSPRTRELLRERRIGYVDPTGNIELHLDRPALYLRTDGATNDPAPRRSRGPSLRGPRAWALLRTLAEVEPPYTVGELAEACGVDDGYASRVVRSAVDERAVEREPRQPIAGTDWRALIELVTGTGYSLLGSNETTSWIAPAGPDQFLRDVSKGTIKRCALTGSFAARRFHSLVAPTVAVVYTDDPERLAKNVRLLPVATGGNVITAVPYDPIVFNRTWERDGVTIASMWQIAIDCLTGFSRMPQEGEALIDWMGRNEARWRGPTLEDLPGMH